MGVPAASAAVPTEAELTALVDGEIAGLDDITEIAANPVDGRIAFVASVKSSRVLTQTDQLWLIARDGTGLQRLEASTPTSWSPAYDLWDLRWTENGTHLGYRLSSISAEYGRDTHYAYWTLLDLRRVLPAVATKKVVIEGSRTSASGSFFVIDHDGGRPPHDPEARFVEVFDTATMATGYALARRNGVWQWDAACTEAAKVGPPSGDPFAALRAALNAQAPGCAFEAPGWVAPPPTAATLDVAKLIDGRIPGLVDIEYVLPSPDGTRLAINARISHPETISVDHAVWVISADGTGLKRIADAGAGAYNFLTTVSVSHWSADGRSVTFFQYQTHPPRSQSFAVEVVPAPRPEEPKPTTPVEDRPLETTPVERPLATTPLQTTPTAGQATPTDNATTTDPRPATGADQVPLGSPTAVTAPATPSQAKRQPRLTVISTRIVPAVARRRAAVRAKIGGAASGTLRVYALAGTRVLGRKSAPADATTTVTVPLVRGTLPAAFTLRVVSIRTDGTRALAERRISVAATP